MSEDNKVVPLAAGTMARILEKRKPGVKHLVRRANSHDVHSVELCVELREDIGHGAIGIAACGFQMICQVAANGITKRFSVPYVIVAAWRRGKTFSLAMIPQLPLREADRRPVAVPYTQVVGIALPFGAQGFLETRLS